MISLDSISNEGYNQAKGKDLFGKFEENALRTVDLVKNTEVIYLTSWKERNENINLKSNLLSPFNKFSDFP